MDPRMTGLIGGIAGTVIGLLGGAIGTYFSIKNTAGPRERAFMIRVAALTWVAVTAFVVAILSTPIAYQAVLWIVYALALPLAIRAGNRRQAQIRCEESSTAGSA
jgi:hypothetical protein